MKREYKGLDIFRIVAAMFVVAIHISPLSKVNRLLDYEIVLVLGRIAVPFFLMCTGYFTLSKYVRKDYDIHIILRSIKKLAIYYGISIILYLPLSFSTIKANFSIVNILKEILFEGTFYHLWYFPATIIGLLIVAELLKRLSLKQTYITVGVLYAVGLLGDSYYGIIKVIPGLNTIMNMILDISGYTRNGIFYVPIFLLLGYLCSTIVVKEKKVLYGALSVSTILLLLEGFVVYTLHLQRHTSMYIFLLAVSFFLFQYLLSVKGDSIPQLRNISMYVYVVHPWMISIVQKAATYVGVKNMMNDMPFTLFIIVCILSFGCAYVIQHIIANYQQKRAFD